MLDATYNPNPTQQRPPGVSGAWMATLFAFATVIVAALYLTRGKPKNPHPDIDFKQQPAAADWYHHPLPADDTAPVTASAATPMVSTAAAATTPALKITAPSQVVRGQATTQCAACQQRAQLMQQIDTSPIDIKIENNTREIPQQDVSNEAGKPIIVTLTPPGPHTVSAWTYLYATLQTGINSDHPGDVIARVSQTITDSVTQTEPLIPQGSILHGSYKGTTMTDLNDTSVVIGWDDLELMPSHVHVPLPNLPTMNAAGYPGLDDQVNRHLLQQFGPLTMISAITALVSLSNHSAYGNTSQGYDSTTQATDAFGQTMGQGALNSANNYLQTPRPTITVRVGTVFRILLTRDLQFPGPAEG